MGIPGELIFDIVLDLSDIPQKEEIKQRWHQRQETQQQNMMMQLQMKQKPQQPRVSISYKGELPPAEQMQAAAKLAGLSPQPQDYGLPAPPQPTPQQIALAALAGLAQQQQQQPAQQQQQNGILVGSQVNPALIKQNYLANRPVQSVTRTIQPPTQESIRAAVMP
jgi:hypothetical protein